jgi:hypothetical protein
VFYEYAHWTAGTRKLKRSEEQRKVILSATSAQ